MQLIWHCLILIIGLIGLLPEYWCLLVNYWDTIVAYGKTSLHPGLNKDTISTHLV